MTPIKKAAGGKTTTATNSVSQTDFTGADLALTTTSTMARIDSRLLALQLDNRHKAVMTLIERYALLTEDQSYFLLSLSRNTDTVVALKSMLIRAFGQARRAADLIKPSICPGTTNCMSAWARWRRVQATSARCI